MFYFRNKFNETAKAAYTYIHILKQISSFLRKPLDSTRSPPHFAIAIDKSTSHNEPGNYGDVTM